MIDWRFSGENESFELFSWQNQNHLLLQAEFLILESWILEERVRNQPRECAHVTAHCFAFSKALGGPWENTFIAIFICSAPAFAAWQKILSWHTLCSIVKTLSQDQLRNISTLRRCLHLSNRLIQQPPSKQWTWQLEVEKGHTASRSSTCAPSGTAQHSTAQPRPVCVSGLRNASLTKTGSADTFSSSEALQLLFPCYRCHHFQKCIENKGHLFLWVWGEKKSTYIMGINLFIFFFFARSCSFGAFGHTCSQPNCFPLYFLSFSVVVPLWEVGSRSKSVSVCLKTKEQWNIQPSLPEQISFFFPFFLFFFNFQSSLQ